MRRECLYCSNTEHDIRRCVSFLSELKKQYDIRINLRKTFLDKANEMSFGIGALVCLEDDGHRNIWRITNIMPNSVMVSYRRSYVCDISAIDILDSSGDSESYFNFEIDEFGKCYLDGMCISDNPKIKILPVKEDGKNVVLFSEKMKNWYNPIFSDGEKLRQKLKEEILKYKKQERSREAQRKSQLRKMRSSYYV